MTENLTRKYNLVQEITDLDWFVNPVCEEGYEIILLEKRGNSEIAYYTSLKKGHSLSFAEKSFKNYIALQVDIRHSKIFQISGEYNTKKQGEKISIKAIIRFHVSNARIFAIEISDPLEEMLSGVIANINRELQKCTKEDITIELSKRLTQNIENFNHLGIVIEDAEIELLDSASQNLKEKIAWDNSNKLDEDKISLEAKTLAQITMYKAKSNNQINLSDINLTLHEYPELQFTDPKLTVHKKTDLSADKSDLLDAKIDSVKTDILKYIEAQRRSNGDIDPNEISNIMRNTFNGSDFEKDGDS